jgi:hypothetical protein
MRWRVLLVLVAVLAAGLLVLAVPATAADSGASVDAPAASVGAPEPIREDDAPASTPRFSSSPRSTIAEASAGPQLLQHPATVRAAVRGAEPIRAQVLGSEPGDTQPAGAPRALYLVLCTFLS